MDHPGNQPAICGNEQAIEEAMNRATPVFLPETNLRLEKIQSCFAVALHMHQPLIPTGEGGELISNLDNMFRTGDEYNAGVFADCYGRCGSLVPELAGAGHNPRVMLDYSGQLLYGLAKMGKKDVLDRMRPLACDPAMRRHAEWLGTMWGHAVAPSTPPPDYKLHMRAWQHEFAALYGLDALARVRGFSPPEMHLPNHPDVSYEYIKALRDTGYRWLLVQEHTVEAAEGSNFNDRHIPYRLMAKNSQGEEVSIIALIKTQGSDTKLVAQMQPYYEAKGQSPRTISGISIPPIVTQIGDGENGGVMMNEFPPCFKQTMAQVGTGGTVAVNGTEYIELIEKTGLTGDKLPALRPAGQGFVLSRIKTWAPGAAEKAIAEIKKENPNFAMDGGSWTNDRSWVSGYDNVLSPMNKLSADFHTAFGPSPDTRDGRYQEALFLLLTSQTSCFRYWGQGAWTDYAKTIIARGDALMRARA
ncbi:MAG: glycosyl hydrolase family 57 [Bdellovibrionales bacterium RIFOXYD1_FULL_53_11]|nr:MAG: glycosyl hydrolase family 57 [Bdellovibrionales bacterium RIFOXYD1_FULL_53_11]